MDTQLLLKKPESTPKVEPKITKIDTLSLISRDTKKTSDKLRKIFEKGTYQKKTQITILNRYKKKLDRLEKQENDRRKKREKTRTKFQAPKIKQFKGSFFDAKASDNPLKALGLLAAFNAVDNTIKGDFSKAIGPALVAGGIFLGPLLASMGLSSLTRSKSPGASPQVSAPVSKVPWWEKNTRSLSRSNQSYARFISKEANIGDRARLVRRGLITPRQALSAGGPEALATSTNAGRVSKAFAKFGGSIIPGVGAVIGAADATLRAQSGDVTGSAIAGTAAGLDAFAAASAATGFGLPLAGLASIASFALDLTNLVRDLSGMSASEEAKNKDRLKEQTTEQKKLVEKSKEERQQLTFSKTLNSYERSINKFDEFSKAFKVRSETTRSQEFYESPLPPPAPILPGGGYDGPVDGNTFFPLPGGDVGTRGRVSSGQRFGAPRDDNGDGVPDRPHDGLDMTHHSGALDAPVAAYKTGRVVNVKHNGDKGYIEIDHGGGIATRYVHVTPMVTMGQTVYGGQQIAKIFPDGDNTHLHFEFYRGSSPVDPEPILKTVGNRPTTPLTIERARQASEMGAMRMNTGGLFNLELHHPGANESKRSGLIESVIDPLSSVSNAFISQFGTYGRGFRDLGGPKRGLNLLELANEQGVDANARKILNIIRANPNTQFNLFAGHTDVQMGPGAETGAPGEQQFVTAVARKVMELASRSGLGNVNYYAATARVGPNDPRANWNIAKRLREQYLAGAASRSPVTMPAPSSRPATSGTIARRLPYQSQYSGPIVVPIPIPRQSRSQVQLPSSQEVMVMSGPSEEELLNSFYKRVLLNTLQ